MEQYLTTIELSKKIKMSPGTIRNLVWKKVFKKDVHYIKPTPRKLLFVWSKVESWLHTPTHNMFADFEKKTSSLINI